MSALALRPKGRVAAACCGGHRPAGECCWKCPGCAPGVLDGLGALCAATSRAVEVLPLEYPTVQGRLT
jgi:hypothetical protein